MPDACSPVPADGSSDTPSDHGVPTSRRRAQTRRRLLDAALEVFADTGFGRATVEEVTARAGFTRGAFYSNFTSLEELFLALVADRAAQIVAVVQEGLSAARAEATGSAVADGLPAARIVDHVVAVLPRDRRWFLAQSEFTAHAVRHPEFAAALVAQRSALRDALVPVLRLVAPAEATEVGVQRLARAVVAVSEGMIAQMVVEPDDATLPALHRQLLLAAVSVLEAP